MQPGSYLRNIIRRAGVPIISFHGLRHTFASHYVMSGGNLYTLSKILGHKDIMMTQRCASLSPEFISQFGRVSNTASGYGTQSVKSAAISVERRTLF